MAIAYSGASGYQLFSDVHSSEIFMQEDGISRMFVSAGMILLFCGIVLIITVLISYLGKRIPEYTLLKRMGISNADFRKMIILEAGIAYLIAIIFGFIVGSGLLYGFKTVIVRMMDVDISLGKISGFTYPLICVFALFIYIMGFLLVKELDSDFRVITNTQETARREKLVSKISVLKMCVGIALCVYAALSYTKLYKAESALLIVCFFAGAYLIYRHFAAIIFAYIKTFKNERYYKYLLKNNRFYYRPNTIARYILFFSLISFLGCFYFGFQIISVTQAEKESSLYPYEFMCIANVEDNTLFEQLKEKYNIELTEYPMVRVSNLDKTERIESGSATPIQGQQIGISEETYHTLKRKLDANYQVKDLKLDEEGKNVYIVHQQDKSKKAQPVDWYYGKANPNLHVGIPSLYCDPRNQNTTYYEKNVVGEEISSLTGCFSTEKCENIIVFSDEYFMKAKEEWKEIDAVLGYPIEIAEAYYGDREAICQIQGPTKLVLINADDDSMDEIDDRLERVESEHQYIGNYDPSVRFHYSSKTAIQDMKSERAIRIMISFYIMILLLTMDMIMVFSMCQMEKREKNMRDQFLNNMGMPKKERKKLVRRELYVFYVVPVIAMIISTGVFFRVTCTVRQYQDDMMVGCAKLQGILLLAVIIIKGIYFFILCKWLERKGLYDE